MVEPGKTPKQVGPIFSAFSIRGERTECLLMHAISWSFISLYIPFQFGLLPIAIETLQWQRNCSPLSKSRVTTRPKIAGLW